MGPGSRHRGPTGHRGKRSPPSPPPCGRRSTRQAAAATHAKWREQAGHRAGPPPHTPPGGAPQRAQFDPRCARAPGSMTLCSPPPPVDTPEPARPRVRVNHQPCPLNPLLQTRARTHTTLCAHAHRHAPTPVQDLKPRAHRGAPAAAPAGGCRCGYLRSRVRDGATCFTGGAGTGALYGFNGCVGVCWGLIE